MASDARTYAQETREVLPHGGQKYEGMHPRSEESASEESVSGTGREGTPPIVSHDELRTTVKSVDVGLRQLHELVKLTQCHLIPTYKRSESYFYSCHCGEHTMC